MVLFPVATVVAWRLVVRRKVSIWVGTASVSTAAGIATLVAGRADLSPKLSVPWALLAGAGTGAAFYVATAVFVVMARRVPFFDAHVVELYAEQHQVSLPAALVVAALLSAPGEELFWRGLFQGHLAEGQGRVAAAVLTWAVWVVVYLASQNLAIIAGAVVGGAVWGALALWTHGVLAPIVSHSVWTALMVAEPPGGRQPRSSALPGDQSEPTETPPPATGTTGSP